MYYYLGKNPALSLNDDFFLQIHFLLYFGPEFISNHPHFAEQRISMSDVREFYKPFLLEDKFTVKRIVATKADERITSTTLHNYALSLKSVVEYYYQIYSPRTPTCRTLTRCGSRDFGD